MRKEIFSPTSIHSSTLSQFHIHMKKIITIVVVFILVGLVAFRLISNKEEIDAQNTVTESSNTRVTVNTVTAEKKMSSRSLNLLGTLSANQVIDIKSETQGKVTDLYVQLGDKVKRGQVIARIDNRIQTIAVSNAERALADAKQNYERYKNLYEGGAASQAQLDQYTLAYENTQNQVAQAKKELTNATVVSPVSGQITDKALEAGSFVTPGTPIATVVDVSKLKVELTVAEGDAYTLNEGDTVNITSNVYPEVTYHGTITFISPRGDEAHNYPVEVAFTNDQQYPLKAGTYVNVAFDRNSQVSTLQIPRDALIGSIRNAQVYVVADSTAYLTPITVGRDYGASVEVLKGLDEGDQVVTTGQINLTDSTQVSVIQ